MTVREHIRILSFSQALTKFQSLLGPVVVPGHRFLGLSIVLGMNSTHHKLDEQGQFDLSYSIPLLSLSAQHIKTITESFFCKTLDFWTPLYPAKHLDLGSYAPADDRRGCDIMAGHDLVPRTPATLLTARWARKIVRISESCLFSFFSLSKFHSQYSVSLTQKFPAIDLQRTVERNP